MRVCAVDLGATSVRVATVDLSADVPAIEVVHRWPHGPVRHEDGTLRWDWPGIVAAVEEGLERAVASGPVASIGVDGWAVDHGLLDADGSLLGLPFSHRDERTSDWRDVVDRIGADRLYGRTGIQLMPINTLFQLAAHDAAEKDRADRIVLLPDLLVAHLTGHVGAEFSNATTTAMLDVETGDWDPELLEVAGVHRSQLPDVRPAGEAVGTWRDVPVHTVGSHDTASAFLGVPGVPGPGTAVVSSGTWVLVGAERDVADTSAAAREANFSNEGGAWGGVRFLKNVVGFWLLERCREAWGNPPVTTLVEEAAEVRNAVPTVDLAQDRFLAPGDLEHELRTAAGLAVDAPRPVVVRCILESIVDGAARAIDEIGAITGVPRDEILHVGGGSRLDLVTQLLQTRTGLPVRVGSPEATALGNAVVQGVALGTFANLDEGRRWVGGSAGTGALASTGDDPGRRRR